MFADIRGHRAWYERHGDAGPPILLVMGFGMSGVGWRPLATRLGTHHQVVLYDCRGLGQSSPGQGPHGLVHLADDAAGLIEHLGWPAAHVVGVSMGGMVAQQIALRHRSLVRSLTLIATHGGPFAKVLPSRRGLQLFLEANIRKGPRRLEALQRLLFPSAGQGSGAASGLKPSDLQSVATPASAEIRRAHLLSLMQHHTLPFLSALHDLPTLVVKPSLDILVPPHGSDMLMHAMPRAKLVTFPTAGHGITSQCAPTLAARIAEHVDAAEEEANSVV